MPYSINRYNGTVVTVVEDGTIDNTLDIKLIGKNYAGYGEVQNENYVHLLEHFSSITAPPRPISGQIWFDSGTKKLKFYDSSKWRTTGGAEISSSAPTGLTTGDFWFDNVNNQLYAWSGTEYILIGPQGVAGSGTTQFRSRSLKDTLGVSHAVIESLANGATIYIISAEEFTLDNAVNPLTGFSVIKQGFTLCYTDETGVTSTNHRYWGTSSNSMKLNGHASSDFTLANAASFSSVVRFADGGLTIGDSNDLAVFIQSGTIPVIQNAVGDTILFQTNNGSIQTPLKIVGLDLLPGVTTASNIGSSSLKYATIYASSFSGVATQADTLNVGGVYRNASTTASVNTIAARDANGDIYANLFQGVATAARYADLAEKYLTDAEYSVGTVIAVGGEKEVTAAAGNMWVIGVVSENPAFMMNKDLVGGTYIALKGRVPVRVLGPVMKGDRLVASTTPGVAVAASSFANPDCANVFAIALADSNDMLETLIEAIVL